MTTAHDCRDSDAYIVIPCSEHRQISSGSGHGNTNYEGRHTSLHRVIYCRTHRVSLAQIHGLVVRHDCDNPRCIEPLHLRIGTQKDNVHDSIVRGRARNGIFHGEANKRAKLRNEQVLEMRSRHAAGGISNRSLAAEYGVTPTLVGYIVRRLNWTHI